jgi:hypothetical protein
MHYPTNLYYHAELSDGSHPKLQSIQEATYLLFEEIEGQGTLLEQVVVTVKQQLEGTYQRSGCSGFH